jgi:N6-L-threonylcarbamoyladenine synthase
MAKGIAASLGVPLIGVNHLVGHLASLALSPRMPEGALQQADPLKACGPMVVLLVSGGHTALVRMNGLGKRTLLGQTLDDAAGEAYDKVAKILELGYPGGPIVDRLAQEGNPKAVRLPRSFLDTGTPDEHRFNFSFSGLKTAVLYHVRKHPERYLGGKEPSADVKDLCASFQAAVVDVLVEKLLDAARAESVSWIGAGGGVSLNRGLRERLQQSAEAKGLGLLLAPAGVCTDNALMIGLAARTQFLHGCRTAEQEDVDPVLSLKAMA